MVAALEQQWLQSQKTNNPDLVAPLLADKFVNTSTDGKVTGRTDSLTTAKATKYASVDYDDLKVTMFGDAAIATGTFTAKGIDSSVKPGSLTTCAPHHSLLSIPTLSFTNAQLFDSRFH